MEVFCYWVVAPLFGNVPILTPSVYSVTHRDARGLTRTRFKNYMCVGL